MTLVAAGCPTTFCKRTAVRSSMNSDPCFLVRFCEFFGLSAGPSDFAIGAAGFLARERRFSSGRFGSFIQNDLVKFPFDSQEANLSDTGRQMQNPPDPGVTSTA